MTCCIVGLLILSIVNRIRRAAGVRVDQPVLFAPVARRPGPGETAALPVARPAAVTLPPRADSPVLRYSALAIVACLVGYPLLAYFGTVDNTGSVTAWALRSGLYVAAVVAAVMLSRSGPVWRAPRGVGTVFIVAGAVVFELGMLDMHVFRLFAVDSSNMLALMAFHNAGPALAMLGGAVLLYGATGRRNTSSRSSRSTFTSAQPSSSAVTVSSTPPVTA
jgi:hypothetical protein